MVVNDGMMDSGGGDDICEYPVAYLVLMFSPALLYHDLYIDPRLLACNLISSLKAPLASELPALTRRAVVKTCKTLVAA